MKVVRLTKSLTGVLAAFFLLSLFSCSGLPVSEDTQKVWFKTANKTFLEKNKRDDIESWTQLKDDRLIKYVTSVGEKVQSKADIRNLEYRIINTPVVQAVSEITLGRINITLGMLNSIHDESELACLLGHEIAHIVQDQDESIKKEPNTNLKNIYDQLSPHQVHGLGISQDLEDISYANYSKAQETNADEKGSVLCADAGYDAFALSRLQNRIGNEIKYNPLVKIRNLKGTHDQIADRSIHLGEWLKKNSYVEGKGKTGAADLNSALRNLSKFKANPTQKKSLDRISKIQKELDAAKSLSPQRVLQIVYDLATITQQQKIEPIELFKLYQVENMGVHFMSERVVTSSNRYGDARAQIVLGIFTTLEMLGRFAIGFTPLGTLIDLHDLIKGQDFFTGQKLSVADRAITAVGLAIGQGKTVRTFANELKEARMLSAESRTVLKEAEEIANTESIVHAGRHGPLNPGRLHDIQVKSGDPQSVADTFRSSSYTALETSKVEKLYQVKSNEYAGGPVGRYWTDIKPTGPTQATLDYALDPDFNNKATHWIEIEVPPGTVYYQGAAGAQKGLVGGGNQIFIEKVESSWIKNQGAF